MQDTINLGHIIGIPGLLLDEGKELEKDGKRIITRIARGITPDEQWEIRSAQERQLLGHDVSLPESRKTLGQAKVAWVKKIQGQFKGHLIRRDKNSKRPDGGKINDLEPYEMHMVPVSLEDWEMRVLADSMGDVMSKKADGMLGDITSEVSLLLPQ